MSSHVQHNRLIGRALWGNCVALSQHLGKTPLSLAHLALGFPIVIEEIIAIFNGKHLSTKLLPKVIEQLNNLANKAGLPNTTLEEITSGITFTGIWGEELPPPPQMSPELTAQAEWLPFRRERLLLLIFQQNHDPIEFLAEFGGEAEFHPWRHGSRKHFCPRAVANKLGIAGGELAQPLVWEERRQLAFWQQSHNQPKTKRYCDLQRIALALARKGMTKAEFCRRIKIPQKELSPRSPFWASLKFSTLEELGISPENAILRLTNDEEAELIQRLQAIAHAQNTHAA